MHKCGARCSFPKCQGHRGAPPHGLRGATPSRNMNVCKYEQGEEMELRHTTREEEMARKHKAAKQCI